MTRRLWALMTWSTEYGAPVVVVGVLGLDLHPDGSNAHVVAWMPREYTRADTWRERLATTPLAELPTAMAVWEMAGAEPAVPTDLPPATGDLATAVAAQLDELLGTLG